MNPRPFIYLPLRLKMDFKNEIKLFVDTYINRIAPVFASKEEETEKITEEYINEISGSFNPEYHDPADFQERAREYGYKYFDNLSLMQYNTRLMNIASLYQYWEQQIRRFTYYELTRQHKLENSKGRQIEFKTFCNSFKQIESLLVQCGVNINDLDSWEKINELRLLQNVIKHGDGVSSSDLEVLRPEFFRKSGDTMFKDLYLTVLNDQVLEIEDNEIVEYGEALQLFWDELPEHMYLDVNP